MPRRSALPKIKVEPHRVCTPGQAERAFSAVVRPERSFLPIFEMDERLQPEAAEKSFARQVVISRFPCLSASALRRINCTILPPMLLELEMGAAWALDGQPFRTVSRECMAS
jgi:hypothetical protein